MTDKPQPDKFDWATELSDAQGHVTLSKQEAKEIGARMRRHHAELETLALYKNLADEYGLSIFPDIAEMTAELETLRAKLKTYEDLGDAADDVQILRMGYAAARLEIESLRKEHADELAVAYMCGASREKELVAQQTGAAYAALPDIDEDDGLIWQAIFDWKDCERGAPALAAADRLSRLLADQMRAFADATHAIRVASHGQAPAQAAPESFLEIPDVQDESGINSHYSRELVLECINSALASHWQAPAPTHFGDEAHVAIPQMLLGAACSAIDKKRDGTKVLAELRRYTTGDLSQAIAPAPAAVAGSSDDLVTRESAMQAIEHLAISNSPGREDDAIAMLAAAPTTQPAPQQEPSYISVQLAEMVLSDCGHSSNYTPLLDRVAARIDAHVERRLDEFRSCLEYKPAPQPSPAAQGDALDAARWHWLSEHIQVAWNEGKFTSLVRIVSEQHRQSLNASVDRMMAGDWSDADRAAQEGKSNG